MVGVVQQNLDAELFQRVLGDAFHRADGPDGHEDRRLHLAMRREQAAGARQAVAGLNLEAERHHLRL